MKTSPMVLNYNNESSEGVFDISSNIYLVAKTDIDMFDQLGFTYYDDDNEGHCEYEGKDCCTENLFKTIPYGNIRKIKPDKYDGSTRVYAPMVNDGTNPFVISQGYTVILCREDEVCDYLNNIRTGLTESAISMSMTYYDMGGNKRKFKLYTTLIDDHDYMKSCDIDIRVFLDLSIPQGFYNTCPPDHIVDVTSDFEERVGVVALYNTNTDEVRYFIVEHGFLSQETYDPLECSMFGEYTVVDHTDEGVTCFRKIGNHTHVVMYDTNCDICYSDICLTSDFKELDLYDLFNDCINDEFERRKIEDEEECYDDDFEEEFFECSGECKKCLEKCYGNESEEEDYEYEDEYECSGECKNCDC